jgi:glycosyltransferase involved in cell wall biosynthesis
VNVHFLADWGLSEILSDRRKGGAGIIATAWGSDIVHPPGENQATADLTHERKALLRTADAVTTCGPTFAATVATYASIPPTSIHVVPFGVDLSLFQPLPQRAKPDGSPCIGFLKGFRTVYGPRILIQAMPRVLERFPESRFELIGTGNELESCRALVHKFGIDHAVKWDGPSPHCEIPQRLQRWDISVIPSIHEAFGVAALESQAMEVPVVASMVGGLLDTVRDGETGLHFPVGQPIALADRLVHLICNPEERKKMGASGREMVSRLYDWDEVAGRWEGLYSQVREEACVMA